MTACVVAIVCSSVEICGYEVVSYNVVSFCYSVSSGLYMKYKLFAQTSSMGVQCVYFIALVSSIMGTTNIFQLLHVFEIMRQILTQDQTAALSFTNLQIKQNNRPTSPEMNLDQKQPPNQRTGSTHIGITEKKRSNIQTKTTTKMNK